MVEGHTDWVAETSDSVHQKTAGKQKRDEFGRFFKLSQDREGEELVDVKIHNPFKRLYALLTSIKKHQETTFAFKLKVPLIALPILLAFIFGLGGFGLGRLLPVCQEVVVTKVGTLYSLSEWVPPQAGWRIPFWPKPKASPVPRVILYSNEETVNLEGDEVDWSRFNGQAVAVSGEFSECLGTLEVSKASDITTL